MGWEQDVWPVLRTKLAVGDIVVLQYDASNYHTVMVTDPTDDVPIAHTEWDGIEIAELQSRAKNAAWVFRPREKTLAHAAVTYAKNWALPPAVGMRPGKPPAGYRYSHARAFAVSHEKKANSPLPFEYEALRRAVKWSLRDATESRFSKNKGTTCCTFVTACYQAAAFSTIAREARTRALTYINEVRQPKAEWRKLDKEGKGIVVVPGDPNPRFPAYKEHSNVGAREPDAFAKATAL